MFTSFAFIFRKKKNVKEKTQLVQDLIPPPNIYVHMCTLYTYTNTYMPRFSLSGFFWPSWCLRRPDPWAHIRILHVQYVCTHTPTYTPTRVKNREDTDNTLISLSVKSNLPRQATSSLHRLAQPSHPRPSTLMNKLRLHERMCALLSKCVCHSKCVR